MRMHAHSIVSACGFVLLSLAAGLWSPACAADVHTLKLATPSASAERAYLGIDADAFALADLQADIIIVEFFSLYCTLCAKEAPAAAELFHLAHKVSTPQRKIVMLGIGVGSTAEEVARFQKQHDVPFPLVPDQKASVARAMKVAITPGFVAFKKQQDGSLLRLYARSGVLGPPRRFLDSTLQAAVAQP